eukprot:scaffold39096_cov78-Phaeocystis_antarctica.AAC.2
MQTGVSSEQRHGGLDAHVAHIRLAAVGEGEEARRARAGAIHRGVGGVRAPLRRWRRGRRRRRRAERAAAPLGADVATFPVDCGRAPAVARVFGAGADACRLVVSSEQ